MWFLLAVFSGFFEASSSAAAKRAANQLDNLTIVLARFVYAIPFLGIAFLFWGKPTLDPLFWLIIGLLLPIELASQLIFQKSITLAPLSLTIPLTAFTPVLTIFIALLTLKEIPTLIGGVGVLFVVLGSYLLRFDEISRGVLQPFQALLTQPGARLMMIVAILWSITTPFQKIAIGRADPVFFGLIHLTTLSLVLALFLLLRKPATIKSFAKYPSLIPVGGLFGVSILFQYFALPLGQVASFLGIKRTNMLWTTVYDRIFFGDKQSLKRVPGIILMLLGVLLIQFGG